MANKEINDLTSKATPAATDEIEIQETGGGDSRKATITAILNAALDAKYNDLEIDGALNHDGTTVGFYGTTPIVQQTGVAVSSAGIHAALVNLGLITA